MAPDLTFTLQIAVTNSFVSNLFDVELLRIGVEPAQAGVLTMIALHEPITPTQLEQVIGLAGGTLRERLKSLERDGYIEKTKNPKDGRSYFVSTTAEGKQFLAIAEPVIRRMEKAIEKATGMKLKGVTEPLKAIREAAASLAKDDMAKLRTKPKAQREITFP
jgi:DNA-binding MarR family transcriptional regulator